MNYVLKDTRLKLNEEKNEFFVAASKYNMKYLDKVSLDICGKKINPSNSVCNLGFYFDQNMTVNPCLLSYTLFEF